MSVWAGVPLLSSWAAAVLVFCGSLLVGRAVTVLAGQERWSGLEPAVGLAAILAAGGLIVRMPGRPWTLVVALAALILGALAILGRRGRMQPLALSPGLAGTLAVTFLLVNLPFAVTGHWGLLGVGYNNDLGLHLAWADWLRSGTGTEPGTGYPLGPHALAAALSYLPKLNTATVFTGELIAAMLAISWTAWHAGDRLDGLKRPLAAVLIAVSYLTVSFYAQAAFKELITALFVLAFTLEIGRSAGSDPAPDQSAGRKRLIMPLVLAAGIVFTYSFPGLAWPAAILAAVALATPQIREKLRPAAFRQTLRRPAVIVPIAGLLLTVLALVFAGSFGYGRDFSLVVGSDAFGPVSPIEALGVWPNTDYRLVGETTTPMPWLFGGIGVLALVVSLQWWWREPRSVWPLALSACALIYLFSLPWMGEYSLAKALVVTAPVAMTVILIALFAGVPESRGMARTGWTALTALFVAGAFASSILVLRDASVAPPGHAIQLDAFRDRLDGKSVLFMDQDRFAPWYLPGTTVGLPLADFPDPDVIENPRKPFPNAGVLAPIDFDSFAPETFDNFDYAISTTAGWQSGRRSFFREVDRTRDFILWKRTGPGKSRPILWENPMPAKAVACDDPGTRDFLRQYGKAMVMPRTVLIPSNQWRPSRSPGNGESAVARAELGPGLWKVSLQYFSPTGVRLTSPGYSRRLPAALDGQRLANVNVGGAGQFWAGGLIRTESKGLVRFRASTPPPNFLQRISSYSRKTRLGALALTLTGTREMIPIGRTCGRWVDFFLPAGRG